MRRRIIRKLCILAAVTSATTFQAASGCNALSGEQFTAVMNTAAQSFFNSLFAQFTGVKIDGLFNVN